MTNPQPINIQDFDFDNFDLLDYIDETLVDTIPIIDSILVDINNWGKYDKYFLKIYGPEGMMFVKLILWFNNISDITNIKLGQFIRFPDINQLCSNLYQSNILEGNLPGINTFESLNNPKEIKDKKSGNKTVAQPRLNVSMKKATYDAETGNIKF